MKQHQLIQQCERRRLTWISRRNFITGLGACAGLTFVGELPGDVLATAPKFYRDPFTLGIASGDPVPDGIVLWTRLAPEPLMGGGMPAKKISVKWQVATDEHMQKIVKRGTALAVPELAHSVHVDVRGLKPARHYWYQFKVGSSLSPIGRTRTAPAHAAHVDDLKFAFASCQHYEHGFYTAYQHMADEDLDLVVHLGDYIYEGGITPERARQHNGPEIQTLADYRNRYALYKTDPRLQLVHALFPWVVTWDDHEVENNYVGSISENNDPVEIFLRRRAAAYQAYYEHMPLRRSSLPQGPDMRLYRRLTFGDLAEFSVLDTRQARTDQPCGDRYQPPCPEIYNPKATVIGARQEHWLLGNLDRSHARWNIIAQQIMMAHMDFKPGPEKEFGMDKWSGYVAARNRLLGFLHERRPSNPIVLSGDIHKNWVADLKTNFDDPKSTIVATEFVGTSITSTGDGTDTKPETEAVLAENPHIKFFNDQRGYVRCRLTRESWQSDYRVVAAVTKPDAPISTRASFIVEHGKPGAEQA